MGIHARKYIWACINPFCGGYLFELEPASPTKLPFSPRQLQETSPKNLPSLESPLCDQTSLYNYDLALGTNPC